MRIMRYQAENFKKLRFINVTMGDLWTIFSGKNGSGKTSAIEGLQTLKHGKKALPDAARRKGTKSAMLEMLLSDDEGLPYLTVRGTVNNADEWKITVVPAPGRQGPPGTPQAVMDELVGLMAIDPFEFIRWGETAAGKRKQVEFLRSRVTLDVDLDKLAAETKKDYEARTAVNKEIDKLHAQLTGVIYSPGLPKEKVDEAAIQQRIKEAGETNSQVVARIAEKTRLSQVLADAELGAERHQQLLRDTEAKIQRLFDEQAVSDKGEMWAADVAGKINVMLQDVPLLVSGVLYALRDAEGQARGVVDEALKQREPRNRAIEQARQVLTAAQNTEESTLAAVVEARAAWQNAPAGELADTAALVEELQTAQLTNREIDKRTRYQDLERQIQEKEREAGRLTRNMEEREEQKIAALSAAKMPVAGLSFNEDEVLFNGIPLTGASHAEKVRVVCGLSMAGNPKLRCIPIMQGESLDEESLELIGKLAAENNFQIVMELMDTSGKVGIVLEDGMVQAVNG